MSTVIEQSGTKIGVQELLVYIPRRLIREKVAARMDQIRVDAGEVFSGLDQPPVAVHTIVTEALEHPLRPFGDTGRVLMHLLGQMAHLFVADSFRTRELLGFNPGLKAAWIHAEADFAGRQLVMYWYDTLVLTADPDNNNSGEIQLNGLLFPQGSDQYDPFGQMLYLLLEPEAKLEIWRQFAYYCKINVAEIEDVRPKSGGFLLDRDEDFEYALEYRPDVDRYFFFWRSFEAQDA